MSDIKKIDKNFDNIETKKELKKYDPRVDTNIKVYGLNWFEKDKLYIRCPKEKIEEINGLAEGLYSLVEQPSGGMIAFYSNTTTLKIDVEMGGNFHMAHMAFTGQGGCDLYMGTSMSDLMFYKTASFNINNLNYSFTFFENIEKKKRLFLINLPLYASINNIFINVDVDASVESPNLFDKGRVVVYGTSITQGGCASRPGSSYTNALSRRMGYEFMNFGFSGNGRGQKEIASMLSEIGNVKLFILDYEANATLEMLKNTLDAFIDTLRIKYPTTPIIVMSKVRMAIELHDKEAFERQRRSLNYQRSVVKKHSINDPFIFFLDGHKIFGKYESEATVDGAHPTDLGFMLITDFLEKYLKKWL